MLASKLGVGGVVLIKISMYEDAIPLFTAFTYAFSEVDALKDSRNM